MQLKFMSILVDNQDKALSFYTEILGFQKMADIDMGGYRWLTVKSPDGIEGVELVLEKAVTEVTRIYQKDLFDSGYPAISLITGDIDADCKKLKKIGVKFRGEPKDAGPIKTVLFEDTCGNLINLVQPLH
jgi:predicted enzyme related to lactoylglutathione lyase